MRTEQSPANVHQFFRLFIHPWSTDMKTVTVGPNVVGDKFVGSRIIQWDSMSKEDVNAFSSSQDAVNNEHHCTGELTERRKEDILAPAGHPELNVDFSKSKGANIKRENIEFTTLLRNLEFF